MSMELLLRSLSERWQPEHVVKAILETGVVVSDKDQNQLRKALPRWAASSMPTTFDKAVGLDAPLEIAAGLFPMVAKPKTTDSNSVHEYIERLKASMLVDGTDFKVNRRNHKERKTVNKGRGKKTYVVPVGHRAYNKHSGWLAPSGPSTLWWWTS